MGASVICSNYKQLSFQLKRDWLRNLIFFLGGSLCLFLEGVLVYLLGILSWLDSCVITGIENELNNLVMRVKIVKMEHQLDGDTMNTL